MILSYIFAIFSAFSCCSIVFVTSYFISFVSGLNYPENDSDSSTYLLFTVDLVLVALFMLQHSLFASKYFKDILEDWNLTPISRSFYIMYTAIVLWFVMYLWQPISEVSVWMIDLQDRTWLSLFFTILHTCLWMMLFLQVIVMEPLQFIGIKQVYAHLQKQRSIDVPQLNPRMVRYLKHIPHAGAGCFIALLWLHPYMTLDRLILATTLTAYLCCNFSASGQDYEYVYQSSCSYAMTSTVTHEEILVPSNRKRRM